jgi:DNA helicase-2/ATP-dependent DNA helicase PcrA
MINKTQQDEALYLATIQEKVKVLLAISNVDLKRHAGELLEHKQYLRENAGEIGTMHQVIGQAAVQGESTVMKKQQLNKLLASPYFGRIDFEQNENGRETTVYIGVYSLYDHSGHESLIHDWRAPVSSMFYDFELGKAQFESPSGVIDGSINLKRQYRIRNGRMEFMIENSMNIHDDLLQKELSKSADEKMKNIVATIQKDQNAIIRNETSQLLIIQGVAGSGKTSIALHRIAFLLYRFQDTISSKNILIISPNKVFADYISNVLPELGEERIPEMGIEEIANRVLENKYKFQTFFEQVSRLLDKKDEAFTERIAFKSSLDFTGKLDKFITFIENEYFDAVDLKIRKLGIPAEFILEKFKSSGRLPLLKRFPIVADEITEMIRIRHRYMLSTAERNEVQKSVTKMFRTKNLKELYKNFYQWAGRPELVKPAGPSTLEYADVFPMVYLKIRLEGFTGFNEVKHLIIDEMQDYSPVQYAVLQRLFRCQKTVLGDENQSVSPADPADRIKMLDIFPQADCLKLTKSYRSTFEIVNFA